MKTASIFSAIRSPYNKGKRAKALTTIREKGNETLARQELRRIGVALLVTVMLVSLLAACGGGGSGNAGNTGGAGGSAQNAATSNTDASSGGGDAAEEPEEEEIKGEITWATHRVELIDTDFKRYIEAFKKKYPGITDVKIEGIKDYSNTMRVRMAANEFPDVMSLVQTTPSDFPKYYEPLDDLGWNDRLFFTGFTSYDGSLYGISQQVALVGIVYNKKVFADAGVEPPRTLDELYDISEKLKQKGYTPMATAYKDAWAIQYWEHPSEFIYGSNTLRNDNLNTDAPFQVDNAYGKGLQILRTMYERGYLEKDIFSASYDQTLKDIAAGKTAMMYIGNFLVSALIQNGMKPEDIGFVPLPHDNSGKLYGAVRPDWAYAVSKTSKNKAAAKAFIKFMIEESGDFEDHYIVSPLKDAEHSIPMIAEFMSYEPELMEQLPPHPDIIEIENKMQFKYRNLIQEAIVADNMQDVLDAYNKKWQEARKELNK